MSQRLVSLQAGDTSLSASTSMTPPSKLLSHLPLLRYTTATIALVAIDSLISISLWIAGGTSAYLENSVEYFSIYRSTFDLAVVAAVRGIVLVCCLYYLEHYSLLTVSSKAEQTQLSSRRLAWLCHGIALVLPLSTMIYAIIKLCLIALQWKQVGNQLHITYKILCVLGVVSPGVELALGIGSFYFMWRLTHVLRIRLILQEEDGSNGAEPKKKADIKRLMVLAIPVSN